MTTVHLPSAPVQALAAEATTVLGKRRAGNLVLAQSADEARAQYAAVREVGRALRWRHHLQTNASHTDTEEGAFDPTFFLVVEDMLPRLRLGTRSTMRRCGLKTAITFRGA
jgi:hypothetical protein